MPLIQAVRPGGAAPAAATAHAARFLRANSSALVPLLQGVAAAAAPCPWRPPHSASSCSQAWWRKWWSAPPPPVPQQEQEQEESSSRSMSLGWRLRCGPGLVVVDEEEQVVVAEDVVVEAAAMEPCASRARLTARARPSLGASG